MKENINNSSLLARLWSLSEPKQNLISKKGRSLKPLGIGYIDSSTETWWKILSCKIFWFIIESIHSITETSTLSKSLISLQKGVNKNRKNRKNRKINLQIIKTI